MPTIPLTRPFINEAMKKAVADVLDSRMLTEGRVAREFERAVAEYVGVDYAVCSSNCTTGLELVLRALGLEAGDEVIVPDFTYPATADAVVLAGGIAVVADVAPETMLLTPELAERVRTPRTRAVMPVSAFGNPLDYDRWREWSRDAGVLVLEDAAPALGSSYKGAKVGSFSDATAFSFHPRKSLTTGEGGMVLTNRRDWSDRMRSFKRFGLSVQPDGSVAPPFASIGSNYKLGDIPSALGIEQLKVLDDMVARRAGLAERYAEALRGHVRLPVVTEGGSHSYQTFCVYVDRRDDIMRQLINNGIEANIGTYNLHKEPAFQNSPKVRLSRSYPGGDYVGEMSLALPLYYEMSEETQDIVINALIKILNR